MIKSFKGSIILQGKVFNISYNIKGTNSSIACLIYNHLNNLNVFEPLPTYNLNEVVIETGDFVDRVYTSKKNLQEDYEYINQLPFYYNILNKLI